MFAFEQERWFASTWLCVGREEDAEQPGSYFLVRVADESVIVRARPTGYVARIPQRLPAPRIDAGRSAGSGPDRRPGAHPVPLPRLDLRPRRLVAAAHRTPRRSLDFDAADNGLAAVRLETWQGFVFINLDAQAPRRCSTTWPTCRLRLRVTRSSGLRRACRIEYDVAANWKVIGENYSECYHCPGVHPQLNRLSPYDRGRNFESHGPWAGGWMELVDDAQTMSIDGGNVTAGRRCRVSARTTCGAIYYIVVWPNLLLSLHPDYVMTHQVWPLDAEHSRVVCEWLFDPATMAHPDFDPRDAIDFWD